MCQLAGPCPDAAPEPAGGIQTPGTDDHLSPAAACVAAPTTSLPHCSSERSLRLRGLRLQSWAPCRGRGLRLDLEQDDVIEPLKGGFQVGLAWGLGVRALWFYLQREKSQPKKTNCYSQFFCLILTLKR